jgi:pyruvate/2-oxoglutarate dehydrogenase complex dihydrolipoamide dehydrogenase (E3) component
MMFFSPCPSPKVPAKRRPEKAHAEIDTRALVVDELMRTSCEDVFAAGDCCCYRPSAQSDVAGKEWFQMRLWTQVNYLLHLFIAYTLVWSRFYRINWQL